VASEWVPTKRIIKVEGSIVNRGRREVWPRQVCHGEGKGGVVPWTKSPVNRKSHKSGRDNLWGGETSRRKGGGT